MKYPEISLITKKYWKENDFRSLERSKTIHEVFGIARKILSRMPETVTQVCGPVTNGGKGSIEENLKYLSSSIQDLQMKGIFVFDQMPFEETFHRIVRDENLRQTYENILTDFYEPLFGLGKIRTLYFVPGWESSRGANWEYEKAKEMGIQVIFL